MSKQQAKVTNEVASAFILQAKKTHEREGEIEIDDTNGKEPLKEVSVSAETIEELNEAGGLYVKAWVWVRNSDLPSGVRKKLGIKE